MLVLIYVILFICLCCVNSLPVYRSPVLHFQNYAGSRIQSIQIHIESLGLDPNMTLDLNVDGADIATSIIIYMW